MSSSKKGPRKKKPQCWNPGSPIDTPSKMSVYISNCSNWLKSQMECQQTQGFCINALPNLTSAPLSEKKTQPKYILDRKSYFYFPLSSSVHITCPFCNHIIEKNRNNNYLLNLYTRQHWTPMCDKCSIKQEF